MTHGPLKISYQPTRSNRLIAAWQPTLKYQPQGLPPEPNRFRPLESTLDYRNPSSMYKGELQSTLSNRMVFNVVGGIWRLPCGLCAVAFGLRRARRGRQSSATGSRDTAQPGANPKTNLEYRDKWQMDSGLSVFPERFLGGQHELKVGTTLYWRRNSVGWRVHPSGDYTLIFDRVNNVSDTPAEIQIRNSPTQPDSRANYYAGYIKDTWRVNDRADIESRRALGAAERRCCRNSPRKPVPDSRRCSPRPITTAWMS